ncbi:LytTR family DNA-binding domain-containing protein [Dyadobacter chenwenxiniae]|uniref:LytTR family DNA-binding domain-containing protein n=1 Tax=Dyadobacter chenwenxiniae TaxID=2906456 RepID=A0A9X1PFT0_9BACT|nr:LytTR family DNA-binding domain-containing protein [Dyadobacter chenwenxiniae]MCF0060345.1 LytTR family DNA-binding domain-containing protein [Dyadobacter chenwenxiniae]UON86078.1 LytTR family DNA-binding domain-containing protein [Dyadobacter chenwenxiniae]
MIKVLIVDDELTARNFLHRLIMDFVPEISEVRMARSAADARNILHDFEPDIAFIDIEMPYQNGFELLIKLKNPQFDVIFTTAHNRYAIQALRFSALDYLLKPIDPKELMGAMQRYLAKRSISPRRRKVYENFLHDAQKKEAKEFRLAVTSSKGAFFFSLCDVLRIESDRNYSVIHLTDRKKPFVATKTLKHYEEVLGRFNFIRVHKSHLVNAEHVMRISIGNDFLVLSDGTRIEISRRKREAVLNLLNVT